MKSVDIATGTQVQEFEPVAVIAIKQYPPLFATTALEVDALDAQLPDPIDTAFAEVGFRTATQRMKVAKEGRNRLLICKAARFIAIFLHLNQ